MQTALEVVREAVASAFCLDKHGNAVNTSGVFPPYPFAVSLMGGDPREGIFVADDSPSINFFDVSMT